MTSDIDRKLARAWGKRMRHAARYSSSTPKFGWLDEVGEIKQATLEWITADWKLIMSQRWVIQDEWSQYHQYVANEKGWGLVHDHGMWAVHSVNTSSRFPTNDAARDHVRAAETDPEHPEHNLALLAVNAIIMGNMRG